MSDIVLNFAHFDAEDYYWHKTDIPFTVARSNKERQDMLLSDIEKHGSFVVSGDVWNWICQIIFIFPKRRIARWCLKQRPS